MPSCSRLTGLLFSFLVLMPAASFAQATVSGTVRDSSGGVLPGVTVEATSPALIEKARTTTTDGSGQYRITDLPPGEYSITYALSGFTSVARQGVSVSGSGVIPISIALTVGSVSETVSITAESPLIDTQTTRRETVISGDTINALPITRNYGGVLYATPGLNVQPGVNANDLMPSMATFSAHGGQSTEGRVFVNGVSVNGPFGANSVTQFAFDVSNAEEMQVLVPAVWVSPKPAGRLPTSSRSRGATGSAATRSTAVPARGSSVTTSTSRCAASGSCRPRRCAATGTPTSHSAGRFVAIACGSTATCAALASGRS